MEKKWGGARAGSGRHAIADERRKPRFKINVTDLEYAAIEDIAEKLGVSKNQAVITAVEHYYNELNDVKD